jgi:TRAP-type mannitol/chloroaromatic compound transport system substrate-binding protein
MTLSRLFKIPLGLALAVAVTGATTMSAEAQKTVRLKMHAAWPASMVILGVGGKRVSELVTTLSQKTLVIQHFEPGALVPAYNYWDSLTNGSVKVAFGSPGIHVGKLPALAFFSSMPFGPRPGEYYAWVEFGGGKELLDEFFKRHNLKAVHPCGTLAPETAGWFKTHIKTLDELNGMKIRFFGYGGKVLTKFGVSPQFLAGGDIYPALERGVIDATEFSMPVMDEHFGFYQIAKHYYFPGWHQPASLASMEWYRPTWEGLSEHHKLVVEMACKMNNYLSLAESEAFQFPAIKRMQAKGVKVHRWSDKALGRLRTAWNELAAEEYKNDKDFAKVWDAYSKFRADYKIWGDLAYVD